MINKLKKPVKVGLAVGVLASSLGVVKLLAGSGDDCGTCWDAYLDAVTSADAAYDECIGSCNPAVNPGCDEACDRTRYDAVASASDTYAQCSDGCTSC